MSRIGKKTIAVPKGVTVTLDGQNVTVKGPKGESAWTVADEIEVKQEGDELSLTPKTWCMVVVGCVSYRGFYDRQEAEQFAAELRQQGFDTSVGAGLRRIEAVNTPAPPRETEPLPPDLSSADPDQRACQTPHARA